MVARNCYSNKKPIKTKNTRVRQNSRLLLKFAKMQIIPLVRSVFPLPKKCFALFMGPIRARHEFSFLNDCLD